jgi:Probable cobalt transporter subunit (CbtA)
MVWTLVRRGLVAGLVAGLLAGAFAFVVGEPRVEDAIEIEELSSAGMSDWVVSRDEQRGGLFLATALYGIAVGGLFALGFAVLRGRGASRTDWQLSTRLAAALFVAVCLVPFVKYPANPPAVGDPETLADRTESYLVLIAGSLLALLAASRVAWSIRDDAQPWVRPLLGAGTFLAAAGGLALALPGIDEVAPDFPASLLWEFRISSLGTQAVLWAALGVGFGIASHRAATRPAQA